ncbi:hypothetical protein Taro_019360 [Colocasia esculenta]|uniref:Sulfite exporter TauE/SafE family protein n=1 Tax=Colocasia esculenta TaxID=4460 RepID=A0A843UYX1_COLES|nr:hypothetical protein [Colocasia esculenta]
MEISSRGFVVYLVSASSLAVLSVFFLPRSLQEPDHDGSPLLLLPTDLSSRSVRVWPDLEVNWRVALATVIGFLGSAFGTVGGVGGGGIFVPMLNLIVGFDTKSAAALSKCMIMGASLSSVWYNVRVAHPTKEVPIIDYDLALLFQPMLMLGITIGVALSVVFPYWLITVLIIILFLGNHLPPPQTPQLYAAAATTTNQACHAPMLVSGTSSRSFFKAVQMWEQETILKKEEEKRRQEAQSKCIHGDEVIVDADYAPLVPKQERSGLDILRSNIRWKDILVLCVVWVCFVVLQVLKTNVAVCSPLYWVVNVLQFPVAISLFAWKAASLYRESKERRMAGNWECVCEASIEWSGLQLLFCALCGILGGTVGGLLGSGGGFVLGPLLLEIGVIPQVGPFFTTLVGGQQT